MNDDNVENGQAALAQSSMNNHEEANDLSDLFSAEEHTAKKRLQIMITCDVG